MKDYDQTITENLNELSRFLDHIEGRVGKEAHARIVSIISELTEQKQELETLIKSESVYTLLRFGNKSPSSSGVDYCEEERYYNDLYNISCDLRKGSNL